MACGHQLPLQIVCRKKGTVSQGFHGAPSKGCASWAADWIFLVPWNARVLCWNREELKGREGRGGQPPCAGTASVPLCRRPRGPEIVDQACAPAGQSPEQTRKATSTSSTETNTKGQGSLSCEQPNKKPVVPTRRSGHLCTPQP